eukprot:4592639-Amphidinium_carterae.1
MTALLENPIKTSGRTNAHRDRQSNMKTPHVCACMCKQVTHNDALATYRCLKAEAEPCMIDFCIARQEEATRSSSSNNRRSR